MYSDEERALLAGYDNGDIKMFDLRTNKCAPEDAPTCNGQEQMHRLYCARVLPVHRLVLARQCCSRTMSISSGGGG